MPISLEQVEAIGPISAGDQQLDHLARRPVADRVVSLHFLNPLPREEVTDLGDPMSGID